MKIFTRRFIFSLPVLILVLGLALSFSSFVKGQEVKSPLPSVEVPAEFSLSPNPTYGRITVKSQYLNDVAVEINIYSITGNLVKTVDVPQYQRNEDISIELSGMLPSLYLLELKSGNHSSIKKFVLR